MISKRLLDLIMFDDTSRIDWLPDGKKLDDWGWLEGEFITYEILFEGELEKWIISPDYLAKEVKEIMIGYGSGYCIMSFIDFDGTWFANVSGVASHKKGFSAQNEYDAVFKAAEWIIDLEDGFDQ